MGLENDPNLLATLRSKAWKDLPGATSYRGAPVLDGWAFTEHPRDAWAKGQQRNVPMLIGCNHDEETFFVAQRAAVPATVADFQKLQFGSDSGPTPIAWTRALSSEDRRRGVLGGDCDSHRFAVWPLGPPAAARHVQCVLEGVAVSLQLSAGWVADSKRRAFRHAAE